MNQLFQIDADTWKALDMEEVNETVRARKEFGIYALPYPRVDLRLPLDIVSHTTRDAGYNKKELVAELCSALSVLEAVEGCVKCGLLLPSAEDPEKLQFNFGRDAWLDIIDLSLEDLNFKTRIYVGRGNPNLKEHVYEPRPPEFNLELERDDYANSLIVLLGTRNAVKTLRHRKSLKLGIGAKRLGQYEYTTTISLPRVREDAEGEAAPTGTAKAPHLRRGHIRKQRFGPKNGMMKEKWIEPMFINADPAFVSRRKAYNVSTSL